MPDADGSPGADIESNPGPDPTITGVSTAATAFVGEAPQGPVNDAQHVLGVADYERVFGGAETTNALSDAVRQFFLNGGTDAWVVRVAATTPGLPPAAADLIGAELDHTGIHALDGVGLFNLLVIPGCSDNAVVAAFQAYCEQRRAFLIVDAPAERTRSVSDVVAWLEDPATPRSASAAAYFPWLLVPDPLQPRRPRAVAPSGAIAGICARTDAARGVWTAPAGIDASIRGADGVTCTLTDDENGKLSQLGLNAIRTFPEYGLVSWGARTLAGGDQAGGEWTYVPVRRLALFIEESIDRGTQWTVFEPNGEPLWARLRFAVTAFMDCLFRQGAFQGNVLQKAYFVRCDAQTTTQNDIDAGIVNVLVGFAPLRPAEFVIITLRLRTADAC